MMRILSVAMLALLAGCSQSVQDYRAETPVLSLKEFFSGTGKAYGVLQDWRGRQTLRFTADLCGEWSGERGDLYEVFYFSDGRVEQRHWRLKQFADGKITGTADDVVGMAQGELAGNALYWQYVLRIPYDDSTLDVTVKDWLYLVDKQNLINRTSMHKFGVKVADLTLSIQQQQPQASCEALKKQVAELAAVAKIKVNN